MGARDMVGRFIVAAAAAMLLSNSMRMAAAPAVDCTASAHVLEHFGTDLGLDRDVLTRAEGLLGSDAGPDQSPSASQLATVAEDATDDLDQAAGEVDAAAQNIAQQLDSLNPGPQAQHWREALSKFEAARNEFEGAAAPPRGSAAPGRFIRPLATLYGPGGAVGSTTQTFVDLIGSGSLGPGAITEMGNWIFSGTPVRNPSPSTLHPMTDPYLPVLPSVQTIGGNARRINAHNRILRGLGALQTHNVPTARAELRAARAELDGTAAPMQHLQSEVNQCAQPQQQQATKSSNPAAPSKPARHMGPGTKAAIIGTVAGVPATIAIISALYHPTCCEPPTPGPDSWSVVSHTTFVCGNRQCSGSITIHVPVTITQGLSFAVANQGSGGGYLVSDAARTNGTTDVIYNFTGLQSAMICQPITFVNVTDGYVNTGTKLQTLDTSIPVSCQ